MRVAVFHAPNDPLTAEKIDVDEPRSEEVARHKAAACVVDVAFVGALTGMDVRLSECQVRGDACCTYRLAPLDGA